MPSFGGDSDCLKAFTQGVITTRVHVKRHYDTPYYVAMPLLLVTVLLLPLAAYHIVSVDDRAMYMSLAEAWQLTIVIMHAAPVISLRLAAEEWLAPTAWILLSLACRRRSVAARSGWSASFTAIELVALVAPLTPSLLGSLLLLQAVIVVGFWAGMAVAAQSDNLTFLPLDRDLRKGLRYVLTSRKAQRRMLHEVGGHGAQQGMFACVLIDALGATGTVWPSSFDLLCDAAYLVLAYLIIVLGTAFLLPPHGLPYTKARLR